MTTTQLDRERLAADRPRRDRPPQERGQLFDVVGLAKHLGVSQRFVRRLVDQRRIPFLKIGKFIRFHPDEIDRWVSSHRVDARPR